jgi:hypothetical protein
METLVFYSLLGATALLLTLVRWNSWRRLLVVGLALVAVVSELLDVFADLNVRWTNASMARSGFSNTFYRVAPHWPYRLTAIIAIVCVLAVSYVFHVHKRRTESNASTPTTEVALSD